MPVTIEKMPHNVEAERSVLGAMSFDRMAALTAVELLNQEDFYVEAHRLVFAACVDLARADRPCDMVLLSNSLRERGQLEAAGGAAYLAQMVGELPDVANIEHYARIVRDKAVKRRLIEVAVRTLIAAEADEGTAEDLVQAAQEGVYRVAEEVASSRPIRAGDIAGLQLELARKLSRGEIRSPGLPTGWQTMDDLTSGLHPGEVTMVAARTSVGKSSFVLDMARRAAERGSRVLYLSTEMVEEALVHKVLGAMARVDTKVFREADHRLDTPGRDQTTADERIEQAVKRIKAPDHQLALWNCRDATPMKLRTRCRQMRVDGGLDLVVVDYVQQMSPDGEHRESHEGYMEISTELGRLAGDLAVPVVVVAQLNRNADRHDKEGRLQPPLLSEIGGSTRFEQDAHNVIFLSRDVAKEEDMTDVILAKSRFGATGKRRLLFNRSESRFDQTGGGWQ